MKKQKIKKWILAIGALAAIIGISAWLMWDSVRWIAFVTDARAFRSFVQESGIWSRVVFVGMVVLQVIIALIPGEPFEIAAGYAFGAIEGTVLSLIGATIGGCLVFLLVQKVGVRAVKWFFQKNEISTLNFLKDAKRRNILVFVLMLIPGTPKDLICYCVGLTDMRASTWLLISTIARIPSIATSTVGGHFAGLESWAATAVVFGVTLVLSGMGLLIYRGICKKRGSTDVSPKDEERSNLQFRE